jgi:hypothetical protein
MVFWTRPAAVICCEQRPYRICERKYLDFEGGVPRNSGRVGSLWLTRGLARLPAGKSERLLRLRADRYVDACEPDRLPPAPLLPVFPLFLPRRTNAAPYVVGHRDRLASHRVAPWRRARGQDSIPSRVARSPRPGYARQP